MHSKKVTVWCGLWAGGFIGSYFFKAAANRNVSVNAERYREMISNFFLPKMQELDLHDMWFQQDGATCHMPHSTRNNELMERQVGEHFTSRSRLVNWPPRSCNALDCFLWGYVKANLYTDKPASIYALEDNMEAFIREIPAEMLARVCQKWIKRMDQLKRSRGQHLHENIFKH